MPCIFVYFYFGRNSAELYPTFISVFYSLFRDSVRSMFFFLLFICLIALLYTMLFPLSLFCLTNFIIIFTPGLCTFKYTGKEYRQISGSALGKDDCYRDIISRSSTWLRHVISILVIVPRPCSKSGRRKLPFLNNEPS